MERREGGSVGGAEYKIRSKICRPFVRTQSILIGNFSKMVRQFYKLVPKFIPWAMGVNEQLPLPLALS